MTPSPPAGPRFRARRPPVDDVAAYVSRGASAAAWNHHATVTVFAPAAEILDRLTPAAGVIEPVDEHTCTFSTGADDLTTLATHLGLLDVDFRVDEPARSRREALPARRPLRPRRRPADRAEA